MTKHVQISLFKTHVVSVLELMASQSPTLAPSLCLCRPDHIILKKYTQVTKVVWRFEKLQNLRFLETFFHSHEVVMGKMYLFFSLFACQPPYFLCFFPSFFPCWFLRLVTWHMLKVDVLNTETHSRNTASPSFTSALSPSWLFPLTSMCRVLKSPHTHMSTHTQFIFTSAPHYCRLDRWPSSLPRDELNDSVHI